MKTSGRSLIYTETAGQTTVTVDDEQISFVGRKPIRKDKIIKIVFDNVPPVTDFSYYTFKNKTYCKLSYYDEDGNVNEIAFSPYMSVRTYLYNHYEALIEDKTNGKAPNFLKSIFVQGGKSNKKVENRKSFGDLIKFCVKVNR